MSADSLNSHFSYPAAMAKAVAQQLHVCEHIRSATRQARQEQNENEPGLFARLFSRNPRNSDASAFRFCSDSLKVVRLATIHLLNGPCGVTPHVTQDQLKKAIQELLAKDYSDLSCSMTALANVHWMLNLIQDDQQRRRTGQVPAKN